MDIEVTGKNTGTMHFLKRKTELCRWQTQKFKLVCQLFQAKTKSFAGIQTSAQEHVSTCAKRTVEISNAHLQSILFLRYQLNGA